MDPRNDTLSLPVIRVGEIPPEEAPRRWLVEGLWGAAAVGLLGGAPKSCKSWLGLDLAVSVASGTACLRSYKVHEPGPVLIYLAEDSLSTVRERVCGIGHSRALELSGLDLHVITSPSLRLDSCADRGRLLKTAQRIRPRLLLLDPLVRLHSADENNATEMAQLLSYFRDLQRELDLAILLIHHTRKYVPNGAQAGQGLRGSSDLHAWGDSNLYLRRTKEVLWLSMEHRAAQAPHPVTLELVTSDNEATHLEVSRRILQEQSDPSSGLEEAIVRELGKVAALRRSELRQLLAVNNERLGEALSALEKGGKIEHGPKGWQRKET